MLLYVSKLQAKVYTKSQRAARLASGRRSRCGSRLRERGRAQQQVRDQRRRQHARHQADRAAGEDAIHARHADACPVCMALYFSYCSCMVHVPGTCVGDTCVCSTQEAPQAMLAPQMDAKHSWTRQ